MPATRDYPSMVLIILLGILACIGWLSIGQADDAPGAGMIGIVSLLASLAMAVRLWRRGSRLG